MEKVEEKMATAELDPIWRLLFTCIVNSTEKECKMAREDKYYSDIAIFLNMTGFCAITRGLVAESS